MESLFSAQFDVLAVVPVLVGPLQALLPILTGAIVALAGMFLALFRPATIRKILALIWSQKISAILLLVVVACAVFLAPKLFSGKADVSTSVAGADWPLLRGGLARRAAALDAEDPAAGPARWTFTDGSLRTFYSSPAVVGNRVYVTGSCYGAFTDKGAVYSLDADTGAVVWKDDSGGYRATFSSPAVSGKYLAVGEGLHVTTDCRVRCIDVEASERRREGVVLWERRTKSHVESSPCIGEGKVVVGAGDDGLWCFAVEGDGHGGDKVLWHLAGDKYPDCESSPAIDNGKVYFGLGEDGQAIVCVDAASGQELWRIATPYPVFGAPTIAGGKLFVGMGTGNYVQSAEQVAALEREKMVKEGKSASEIAEAMKRLASAGEVWCVNLATREVAWKLALEQTVLGAIAEADGKLYFGSRDGFVYCITAGGKLAAKWNAHAPVVTSCAVAKEHVYVVTTAGQLFALDRDTMSPVWQFDLPSTSISSPGVARGHVYVGSAAGLVCAGEPGEAREKPVWAGYLGGPGKSGWDGSPVAERGRFAWRWPAPGPKVPSIVAPPAYMDGFLYVGTNYDNGSGLTCLKLSDDASNAPEKKWFAPSTNPIRLSPAAASDEIFVVDGKAGDPRRTLRCLYSKSGEAKWSLPVEDNASGEFVLARDLLLIANALDGLSCVRTPTHSSLWSRKIGAVVGMPLVVSDIAIVAADNEPNLVALDLPSGKTLWEQPWFTTVGPVFAGGKIWIDRTCYVEGYDIVDGTWRCHNQLGFPSAVRVADRSRLAFTDIGEIHLGYSSGDGTAIGVHVSFGPIGRIFVVNAESVGEIAEDTADIEGALAGFPPMLAGNVVLYYDGSDIRRYDIESKKSSVWFPFPDGMGKPTTPMIMVKSNVYFATDRMGLVCVKPRR